MNNSRNDTLCSVISKSLLATYACLLFRWSLHLLPDNKSSRVIRVNGIICRLYFWDNQCIYESYSKPSLVNYVVDLFRSLPLRAIINLSK